MRVFHRDYDESQGDFTRMWQFTIRDNAIKKDRFAWQNGRLGDWKYGLYSDIKHDPLFCSKNAHLWFNDLDELAGFAVSEDGGCNFFIITSPSATFIFAEILDWVVQHWRCRGELSIELDEFQQHEMKILQSRGFTGCSQVAVTRRYALSGNLRSIPLPEGFTIQAMIDNPDCQNKQQLYNNGFRSTDDVSAQDMLTRERNMHSPIYNPMFDYNVVDTTSGRFVSTCLAFIDFDNRMAEVEKVCCHSAWRRRGLTEAVICHCFNELAGAGIETAYITAYSEAPDKLYEKLGPCARRRWYSMKLPSGG